MIEKDYLKLINEMVQTPGVYHLDDMRREIHKKLCEKYQYNYEKLKIITDRLNIAIDFNPPLEKYESVNVYARDLERLLSCTECKYFMDGKINSLRTPYGIIVDEN
jgi:hypothetical protein